MVGGISMCSRSDYIDVSFVIPAYNEEACLPAVLTAVKTHLSRIRYEVILVDNGSTDATIFKAREFGARVLQDSQKTIGSLRNLGAAAAKGTYLVFLDADVVLTPRWEDEFLCAVRSLEQDNRVVTGSRYGVRSNPSWIEKYWFQPMTKEKANYINGGHLIIHRDIFNEIGGFDDSLRTGEDYQFCMRAKSKGICVSNNSSLKVIHEGYPKNLIDFIRRERWHGIQDFSDAKSFVRSLPAKGAAFYWLTWIAFIMLAIFTQNAAFVGAGLSVTSLVCIAAICKKKLQFSLSFPHYFVLYHAYFIARGLSLAERLLQGPEKRKNVL